jgi:hypothetical protein
VKPVQKEIMASLRAVKIMELAQAVVAANSLYTIGLAIWKCPVK